MSDDSFVMEMCGNRAAWQIQVDGVEKIDLEAVGTRSRVLVILLVLEHVLHGHFPGLPS